MIGYKVDGVLSEEEAISKNFLAISMVSLKVLKTIIRI